MASAEQPNKLYRIMDFSKVVQIFETQSLYFANPSCWKDPYEQRIKHSSDHALSLNAGAHYIVLMLCGAHTHKMEWVCEFLSQSSVFVQH